MTILLEVQCITFLEIIPPKKCPENRLIDQLLCLLGPQGLQKDLSLANRVFNGISDYEILIFTKEIPIRLTPIRFEKK